METEIGNPHAVVVIQLLQDGGTALTGESSHDWLPEVGRNDYLKANKFHLKPNRVINLAILYDLSLGMSILFSLETINVLVSVIKNFD